jgi:hypothetical protein
MLVHRENRIEGQQAVDPGCGREASGEQVEGE